MTSIVAFFPSQQNQTSPLNMSSLGSNAVSSSTAIISGAPGDDLNATISRSESGAPRGREAPIDRPRPQGKNSQGR